MDCQPVCMERKYGIATGMLVCVILLMVVFLTSCEMRPSSPAKQHLRIGAGIDLPLTAPWTLSGQNYANAFEIVYPAGKGYAIGNEARISVITEKRLNAIDARQRLIAIAHSRNTKASVMDLGGWPAIEMRFMEQLPEKGIKDQGEEVETPILKKVPRARIAVAFDHRVVLFDVWLAPDADESLLQQAIMMLGKVSFSYALPSAELKTALHEVSKGLTETPQPSNLPTNPRANGPVPGHPDLNAVPAPPQPTGTGPGEVEIAANPAATQIVTATNSALSFSSDGGVTFVPGNPGTFGLSDPTLARGASGNFYLGGIAFPSGFTPPGSTTSFTGCANTVKLSTDGGANFAPVGFSAFCTTSGSLCFPDQPHIAADTVNASPSGQDQLYAVWRNFTPTPCIDCPPSCNALTTSPAWQTSVLACSQDGGATWTSPPVALPGGGDHPRVTVGPDGKVYVVTLDGNSVHLLRFSSCSTGLVPEPGFPVTVADGLDINCPLPGIDRCDTALSSPTAAPDPADPSHIFVTYSRKVGAGNLIVAKESFNGGRRFGGELLLSGSNIAPRFMPWSCATMGSVFAGWYDRSAATPTANDLTAYFVGSPIFPAPLNLSGVSDPQCASGWLVSPRNKNDAETCSTQPQLAGRCQNGSGTGSNTPCDFSSSTCPSGESCKKGGGAPKYGDYNGFACASNKIIGAWTSATPPPGLPAPGGLALFTRVVPLTAVVPGWDQLRFDITTGGDDARGSTEIVASVTGQGSFCLKPSTSRSPDTSCPNNGGGATDQTGRSGWNHSDGVISQTFTVPVPQTNANGFAGLTITTRQGSCFGCTSDNWNLEDIVVTAIDSTGVNPPTVLLNLNSGSGSVNSRSCVLRLKEAPNASTATMSLASPPTNVRTYVGGPSGGMTTSCTNNGG